MKNSFSKHAAIKIAKDYNFLVGRPLMILPYAGCKIDTVEPELLSDGFYRVVVKHDAYGKDSIPELFGFKSPTLDLIAYLDMSGMSHRWAEY